MYLFELLDFAVQRLCNTLGSLHITLIITVGTDSKCIFADLAQKHKFVAYTAAHHTRVGCNGDNIFCTCALIDIFISFVAVLVVFLQILHTCVERIRIFHGKLAHTNKTAPCTGFITEFGLYLIYHKRIVRIGICNIPCKMHSRFLMGHAKHHFIFASVLETCHFAADRSISARLLPEGCRHNDGEHNFLTAYFIHFITDNSLYLLHDALARCIERVNAV